MAIWLEITVALAAKWALLPPMLRRPDAQNEAEQAVKRELEDPRARLFQR